ncbi:hypothetical protein [Streptomyces sp. LN500]
MRNSRTVAVAGSLAHHQVSSPTPDGQLVALEPAAAESAVSGEGHSP